MLEVQVAGILVVLLAAVVPAVVWVVTVVVDHLDHKAVVVFILDPLVPFYSTYLTSLSPMYLLLCKTGGHYVQVFFNCFGNKSIYYIMYMGTAHTQLLFFRFSLPHVKGVR